MKAGDTPLKHAERGDYNYTGVMVTQTGVDTGVIVKRYGGCQK